MHHSINKQHSKLIFTASAALLSLCCLLYSCTYRPVAPIDPNLILDDFAKTIDGGDPRGTYTPNKPFRFISMAKFVTERRGDSLFNQTWFTFTGFPAAGTLTLSGENVGKGTYMAQDFKFGIRYGGEPGWWTGSSTFFGVFHDIFITLGVDTAVKPGDTVRHVPIRSMGVRIPSVPQQASGTWKVRSNKLIFDGDTTNAVSFTANSKALFYVAVVPDSLYRNAGYQATGNTVLSVAFRRMN
jgi:hypothetical protein